MEPRPGHLQIGELSCRVGVRRELLRAWERRYGLLEPTRSPGGYRLYSNADEQRARAMVRHQRSGLSAAQAARAAQAGARRKETDESFVSDVTGAGAQLLAAFERFDDVRADALMDGLLATLGIDTVLGEVLLPTLLELGNRWEAGEATVAQEHFASSIVRGRLLGLARGWGRGGGPLGMLACPPDERHDLGILMFGIALREAGWRVAFLGADTPIATIERAAHSLDPEVVVLSAVTPERLQAAEREIVTLATQWTVAIGGAGADTQLTERLGAVFLPGDPLAAAAGFALSFAY